MHPKFGLNHVTNLVEENKVKQVVIAHDVDPIKTIFSLALLASAAMARTRISGNQEFHDYIGTFGKSDGTVQEMNNRMQIWLENKNTVDNLNATNKGTGVKFGMNETSDLTDSEFRQMQGLVIAFEAEKSTDSSNNNGGSRRLQEDQSIP